MEIGPILSRDILIRNHLEIVIALTIHLARFSRIHSELNRRSVLGKHAPEFNLILVSGQLHGAGYDVIVICPPAKCIAGIRRLFIQGNGSPTDLGCLLRILTLKRGRHFLFQTIGHFDFLLDNRIQCGTQFRRCNSKLGNIQLFSNLEERRIRTVCIVLIRAPPCHDIVVIIQGKIRSLLIRFGRHRLLSIGKIALSVCSIGNRYIRRADRFRRIRTVGNNIRQHGHRRKIKDHHQGQQPGDQSCTSLHHHKDSSFPLNTGSSFPTSSMDVSCNNSPGVVFSFLVQFICEAQPVGSRLVVPFLQIR